jgi:hypothetical protein
MDGGRSVRAVKNKEKLRNQKAFVGGAQFKGRLGPPFCEVCGERGGQLPHNAQVRSDVSGHLKVTQMVVYSLADHAIRSPFPTGNPETPNSK